MCSSDLVVPVAANEVQFSVTGPAKIIGVGNGDPSSHEPDRATKRKAFNGLCMALVQSTGEAGEIRIQAQGQGLGGGVVTVRAIEAAARQRL